MISIESFLPNIQSFLWSQIKKMTNTGLKAIYVLAFLNEQDYDLLHGLSLKSSQHLEKALYCWQFWNCSLALKEVSPFLLDWTLNEHLDCRQMSLHPNYLSGDMYWVDLMFVWWGWALLGGCQRNLAVGWSGTCRSEAECQSTDSRPDLVLGLIGILPAVSCGLSRLPL